MPPARPGPGRSSPGALADSYRAELIRAARKGLDFSPGTGGTGVLGDTRSRHHQLAGARGGLRCDQMAS